MGRLTDEFKLLCTSINLINKPFDIKESASDTPDRRTAKRILIEFNDIIPYFHSQADLSSQGKAGVFERFRTYVDGIVKPKVRVIETTPAYTSQSINGMPVVIPAVTKKIEDPALVSIKELQGLIEVTELPLYYRQLLGLYFVVQKFDEITNRRTGSPADIQNIVKDIVVHLLAVGINSYVEFCAVCKKMGIAIDGILQDRGTKYAFVLAFSHTIVDAKKISANEVTQFWGDYLKEVAAGFVIDDVRQMQRVINQYGGDAQKQQFEDLIARKTAAGLVKRAYDTSGSDAAKEGILLSVLKYANEWKIKLGEDEKRQPGEIDVSDSVQQYANQKKQQYVKTTSFLSYLSRADIRIIVEGLRPDEFDQLKRLAALNQTIEFIFTRTDDLKYLRIDELNKGDKVNIRQKIIHFFADYVITYVVPNLFSPAATIDGQSMDPRSPEKRYRFINEIATTILKYGTPAQKGSLLECWETALAALSACDGQQLEKFITAYDAEKTPVSSDVDKQKKPFDDLVAEKRALVARRAAEKFAKACKGLSDDLGAKGVNRNGVAVLASVATGKERAQLLIEQAYFCTNTDDDGVKILSQILQHAGEWEIKLDKDEKPQSGESVASADGYVKTTDFFSYLSRAGVSVVPDQFAMLNYTVESVFKRMRDRKSLRVDALCDVGGSAVDKGGLFHFFAGYVIGTVIPNLFFSKIDSRSLKERFRYINEIATTILKYGTRDQIETLIQTLRSNLLHCSREQVKAFVTACKHEAKQEGALHPRIAKLLLMALSDERAKVRKLAEEKDQQGDAQKRIVDLQREQVEQLFPILEKFSFQEKQEKQEKQSFIEDEKKDSEVSAFPEIQAYLCLQVLQKPASQQVPANEVKQQGNPPSSPRSAHAVAIAEYYKNIALLQGDSTMGGVLTALQKQGDNLLQKKYASTAKAMFKYIMDNNVDGGWSAKQLQKMFGMFLKSMVNNPEEMGLVCRWIGKAYAPNLAESEKARIGAIVADIKNISPDEPELRALIQYFKQLVNGNHEKQLVSGVAQFFIDYFIARKDKWFNNNAVEDFVKHYLASSNPSVADKQKVLADLICLINPAQLNGRQFQYYLDNLDKCHMLFSKEAIIAGAMTYLLRNEEVWHNPANRDRIYGILDKALPLALAGKLALSKDALDFILDVDEVLNIADGAIFSQTLEFLKSPDFQRCTLEQRAAFIIKFLNRLRSKLHNGSQDDNIKSKYIAAIKTAIAAKETETGYEGNHYLQYCRVCLDMEVNQSLHEFDKQQPPEMKTAIFLHILGTPTERTRLLPYFRQRLSDLTDASLQQLTVEDYEDQKIIRGYMFLLSHESRCRSLSRQIRREILDKILIGITAISCTALERNQQLEENGLDTLVAIVENIYVGGPEGFSLTEKNLYCTKILALLACMLCTLQKQAITASRVKAHDGKAIDDNQISIPGRDKLIACIDDCTRIYKSNQPLDSRSWLRKVLDYFFGDESTDEIMRKKQQEQEESVLTDIGGMTVHANPQKRESPKVSIFQFILNLIWPWSKKPTETEEGYWQAKQNQYLRTLGSASAQGVLQSDASPIKGILGDIEGGEKKYNSRAVSAGEQAVAAWRSEIEPQANIRRLSLGSPTSMFAAPPSDRHADGTQTPRRDYIPTSAPREEKLAPQSPPADIMQQVIDAAAPQPSASAASPSV